MQIMAMSRGNRIETVSVKFSDREKLQLEEIANLHDRGVGYIVRELAFRGLALYKQDGLLKLTESEEKTISNGKSATNNAKIIGTPVFPELEAVKKTIKKKVG